MKIAFVSQWYDPEVGSAAVPGAIVRALRDRGHDVEVVTGFPNYPHGRLYEGYKLRPYVKESIRGVTVHRVPLYPSHDRSASRRILNFLTFMLSASTFGAALARRSQVALIYSTPGTVGMVGIVLRRLLRRPFVLYVQDVWPDTVTATGMLPERVAGPVEWLLHRFCDQVYRAAGRIAVTSPGMKTILVSRGVDPARVDVVYNWVDEDLFHVTKPATSTRAFEVMYAGSIGDVQGLDVAVRAIARTEPASGIALRLVGSGVAKERLKKLASDLGVADRVVFEGPRRIDEMSEVMSTAQVQLVCLKDDPLFHLTMPSKIQATLATGRPLITCAPGDAAELTVLSGAGWAVPAEDVDALASTMLDASRRSPAELEAMGAAGRRYYETRLSSRVGSRMLEAALARAAGRSAHVA